jgi:hypothetical protein
MAIRQTKRGMRVARERIGRIFTQRCFYLFVLLLVLVGAVPFVEMTMSGRLLLNAINVFILIAAVAAVGRTMGSFVITLLLATGMVAFQYLGLSWGDEQHLAHAWALGAALYAVTIVYLMAYVFRPEVMTSDKLFGAAAAYLLLGALWMHLYGLVDHYYPGSFSVAGAVKNVEPLEMLYFSFTVLTSTGFGDIVPVTRQARALCTLEQLVGWLFTAILIARLAGVYPPNPRGRGLE